MNTTDSYATEILTVLLKVKSWNRDWDIVYANIIKIADSMHNVSLSYKQKQKIKSACQIIGKSAWLEFHNHKNEEHE